MNKPDESVSNPLAGVTVMVAVTGGVAAYKTVDVVSRLKKTGAHIQVLMSEAATKFVAPLTFEAISGNPVISSVFPRTHSGSPEDIYPHLYPATRANIFLVAPATADVIAHLAHGFGTDAVTTSALSLPPGCKRFFAPAMNVEMWNQPVVQQNTSKLEEMGWIRIGPDAGSLACGMIGEGRMSEPAAIVDTIMPFIQPPRPGLSRLNGKRILILSGPTCEYIDPIRFISNASSGKMGRALAETAAAQGASVVFLTGPVSPANLPSSPSIQIERIVSADQLLDAGRRHFLESDAIIYAAAVSDYRPASRSNEKLPKQTGLISLALEATPDVAATLNEKKRAGQVAVGFALQTNDGERRAVEKMKAKKFDGIVLNAPDALGGDDGQYTFFNAAANNGSAESWGKITKRACAGNILDFIAARLSK